jgi:hypothetical protein
MGCAVANDSMTVTIPARSALVVPPAPIRHTCYPETIDY